MEPKPVPERAVLDLAALMSARSICYAFMGGIAVNTWGIPRATFDLDLALAVGRGGTAALLEQLHGTQVDVDEPFRRGFVDRLAGMEKAALRLQAQATWLSVDVFFDTTPFLQSALARRVAVDLTEASIWVVTAADLLLFKLLAGRRKDWVDIDNVVAVQGVPEPDYLRQWAQRLAIEDRLTRVLPAL